MIDIVFDLIIDNDKVMKFKSIELVFETSRSTNSVCIKILFKINSERIYFNHFDFNFSDMKNFLQ
ncbi:hypothetical protein C1637_08850 [Chryseobacterium lactis]|uniref:Uncharacterized protein n=1 Tax=Chryseobacterium lactis TaxID=1241981 RepID=A0AA92BD69_CHRLC|nr:hypothetical protein C1637_08850 [Chryseobacterium lactis]